MYVRNILKCIMQTQQHYTHIISLVLYLYEQTNIAGKFCTPHTAIFNSKCRLISFSIFCFFFCCCGFYFAYTILVLARVRYVLWQCPRWPPCARDWMKPINTYFLCVARCLLLLSAGLLLAINLVVFFSLLLSCFVCVCVYRTPDQHTISDCFFCTQIRIGIMLFAAIAVIISFRARTHTTHTHIVHVFGRIEKRYPRVCVVCVSIWSKMVT